MLHGNIKGGTYIFMNLWYNMTKINKPRLQYTSIKKAAFDAVQYIDDRRKGLDTFMKGLV